MSGVGPPTRAPKQRKGKEGESSSPNNQSTGGATAPVAVISANVRPEDCVVKVLTAVVKETLATARSQVEGFLEAA